jgi:hypothetical protein
MKRNWNIVALVVLLISAAFMPFWMEFQRQRRQPGDLVQCRTNCKEFATALEMYASDHSGRYPADLKILVKRGYLADIPSCPASGRETYSTTYRVVAKPDSFSFGCAGWNHGKPGRYETMWSRFGYPWYDADVGYRDAP